MNIIKLMLLAGIIGFGWQYWNKQQGPARAEAATTASAGGFVPLPTPAGASPKQVLVIAPENCTADGARRADELANDLTRQNIPVLRTHNVNFQFENPDPGLMQRLNTVMNGDVPIVFVRGRAKANPTLAEVVAEYRN